MECAVRMWNVLRTFGNPAMRCAHYLTSPLPKSASPSTSASLSLALSAFSVTSEEDLALDWPRNE
jgi:hypothetical protein